MIGSVGLFGKIILGKLHILYLVKNDVEKGSISPPTNLNLSPHTRCLDYFTWTWIYKLINLCSEFVLNTWNLEWLEQLSMFLLILFQVRLLSHHARFTPSDFSLDPASLILMVNPTPHVSKINPTRPLLNINTAFPGPT